MKVLSGFCQRRPKEAGPNEFMRISSIVGHLLDRKTYEVFAQHREALVQEPITYIVPAVWGELKDCGLDAVQKNMNREIAPVVDEVIRSFRFRDLSVSQEFALQYLVRGYMVSRIVYMIEAFRGLSTFGGVVEEKRRVDALSHLEPLGSA